ncbi:unnamed protein product [Rotaria sordida]|uniref:Ubiquitin-activating enzyme E1 n=1 Tax=Rotaria sordida TaxID=392033 RepID=A0A815CQJ1_9BILA|nr:unnamed protein product [Rotaria sordida]
MATDLECQTSITTPEIDERLYPRQLFVFQDEIGVVSIATYTKHGFEDGSYVTVHDVKGITEMNDREFKITVLVRQIFCDFGQNFKVLDTNGEDSITEEIVNSISHDEIGVVSIATYTKHGFEDGSYVTVHDVKGMTEINDREFKITVLGRERLCLDPYTFTIGDTRNFGVYKGSGTVTEVKKAETVHFMSMSANLHLSFQGLSLFQNQYNALPQPWNDKLNRENDEQVLTDQLNKHWIRLFAKTCTGDLCPIQSVIVGIVAQEAIKVRRISFIHSCFVLFLSSSDRKVYANSANTRSNFSSKQSRYYSQEIVFDEDFQDKLGNAKYFLIGSGAVGCEILKNFAMMGIGCGRDGTVFVSNMDSIKISDLHRQFLFCSRDIGDDADKFYEIVEKLNRENGEQVLTDQLNKHWIRLFAKTCTGDLCPIQSVIGGIAAQEAIKTGPGTVGCEILKNFAMMGIVRGRDGTVFVSDMDSIKISNLHRQFLFRSRDIGKMKSTVAAQSIKVINPNMHVHAYVDRVLPETEHIYKDHFFQQLDGLVTAVDNVKTRKYFDNIQITDID